MIEEEEINDIAKVLEEWNPLGEKANSIEGLEGYRYEAMDIISSSRILSKSQNIKESVAKVLTQAFSIKLNEKELNEAANKIKEILILKNVHWKKYKQIKADFLKAVLSLLF